MKQAQAILAAATAAFALLSAGCAITVNTHGEGVSVQGTAAAGSTKFECVSSPSGECHYALYTSQCRSSEATNGLRATTCTHQVFEEFTLASGKSRTLTQLPKGYKSCMKPQGRPEVPGCE